MRNKRLQNKVSESKLTLPIVSLYAIGIWGLYGLAQEGWWIQFGSFFLSAFLMLVLNNTNALIRIYSRIVSSSFLVLSCTACFLFPFISEAICQFFFIAVYLILFLTYQDKASAGLTYYGFLCIGLASLCYVHILCYLPVLWLLMLIKLQKFGMYKKLIKVHDEYDNNSILEIESQKITEFESFINTRIIIKLINRRI